MKMPHLLAMVLLGLTPGLHIVSASAEEKAHPAAGIVSVTSVEVYSGLKAKVDAALVRLNPALAKAGLPELMPEESDLCFAGFSILNADGSFVNYGIIEDTLMMTGKVSYAATSRGTCSYAADKRMDTCKTSDGFEFFIKYTKPDSYLELATVMDAKDLEKDNPGPISTFVACDALEADLLIHADPGAPANAGLLGLFSDSTNVMIATIARATARDPRYARVYAETMAR